VDKRISSEISEAKHFKYKLIKVNFSLSETRKDYFRLRRFIHE